MRVCVEIWWNTGDNSRVQTPCVVPLLVSARPWKRPELAHNIPAGYEWQLENQTAQTQRETYLRECAYPLNRCVRPRGCKGERCLAISPGQNDFLFDEKGGRGFAVVWRREDLKLSPQWLWLPSAGPGHYITESLLSSPWEWLTA